MRLFYPPFSAVGVFATKGRDQGLGNFRGDNTLGTVYKELTLGNSCTNHKLPSPPAKGAPGLKRRGGGEEEKRHLSIFHSESFFFWKKRYLHPPLGGDR